LDLRLPKVGFRANRFNRDEDLEKLNLGKLAYHIEKGNVDTSKPITMKDLLEGGVLSKIKHGVKLMNKGQEKFSELGTPVTLEVNDASQQAIDCVKDLGGSLKVVYRTPLILRKHLKPHKFDDNRELKTPMPPPKKVKKLEKLKGKGLEVEYPDAPWYTNNVEKIKNDLKERTKRINEGQGSDMLPFYPASREPTPDKVIKEKKPYVRSYRF
jgi:large subunit ribosomal protein L15